MKRLRKLALDLDRLAWPNDFGYGFYMRSRSLCNFVERALVRTPVFAVNSSKLCITGIPTGESTFRINSSNIACLRIPFPVTEYSEQITHAEISGFMIRFLQAGLVHLPREESGDYQLLSGICQRFADGGYENEWQHKKRSFPAHGLKAELNCRMTAEHFELNLETTLLGTRLNRLILKTDPDELAFHHRFDDLFVEQDHLIVSSKCGLPLVGIPLKELVHGLD